MATQGLISVVADDKVLMKIVAGCDGMFGYRVATQLRAQWPVTAERAYEIAHEMQFGCRSCLVVLTKDEQFDDCDSVLSPRYRETFDDPQFNPRWDHGTADFVEVVQVQATTA